jgi:phage terminase Nu1 subunit (DNA packaging protein)
VLVPTLQGLFRYYREAQTRRVGTLGEEKEMKVRAERQLLELDLAHKRGDLVELDAVEKAWENIIGALLQQLDVLPSKIESRYHTGLTPRALRDLLERELDELRTNVSKPAIHSKAESSKS